MSIVIRGQFVVATCILEEKDDSLFEMMNAVDPVHPEVIKAIDEWNSYSKKWVHGKCAIRSDMITSMFEVGYGYTLVYVDDNTYRVRCTVEELLDVVCLMG